MWPWPWASGTRARLRASDAARPPRRPLRGGVGEAEQPERLTGVVRLDTDDEAAGRRRIAVSNMPLRLLVRMAYGVQDFQIVGGPSWQMSSKFDITAKAAEGTTKGTQDLLPMMKTLLADRFKLKTHTETRELPTYALVVARSDGKLGPDIKPSTSDCSKRRPKRRSAPRRSLKGGAAAFARDDGKRRDDEVRDDARDQSANPAAGFGLRADGQAMSGARRSS